MDRGVNYCVVCGRHLYRGQGSHRCPPATLKRLEREERVREAAVEDGPDPDVPATEFEEWLRRND